MSVIRSAPANSLFVFCLLFTASTWWGAITYTMTFNVAANINCELVSEHTDIFPGAAASCVARGGGALGLEEVGEEEIGHAEVRRKKMPMVNMGTSLRCNSVKMI